jgi:hypothetical protein
MATAVLGVLARNSLFAANATPIITYASTAPFAEPGPVLADLNFLAALNPSDPGFQNAPLLGIAFAGRTITFDNTTNQPEAGVYQGSKLNVAIDPYCSRATPFCSSGDYFVAQSGDNVVFTFDKPQTSFSLLWGTVDAYNYLEFPDGTIGGADVYTAAGIRTEQPDGTTPFYVTISDPAGFKTLTAENLHQPAFEFIPAGLHAVPEPASFALFGCGLIGLAMVYARRPRGL